MFYKHSIWVVVSLLLFVSIIARVAFFSSQNLSLYWDEVAIAVDARSVAHFGHDIHGNHWLQPLYPSYGDYKLPGLIIIVSFLYRLLPEYDWLVRIPSLVSGLLTICLTAYLTFVITKRYGSQTPKLHRLKLMVSTAFVVGISPWAFHFSLVGFESMLAQALVLISIASLLQGFIRKQANWYAVALFFGIAASYTYYAAQYIWPVIFMMLCILEVSNKSLKQIMSSIGTAVGVLLLFYVALVPMYFSEHFTSSQIVRMSTDSVLDITTFVQTANEVQTVATSKLDSILFNRRVFILRQLLENVFSHLDPRYLFFTGDSNMRHGSGVSGLFNLTMLLPLLVGMSWLFSKSKKLGLFLLTWVVVGILPASIPLDVPNAQRSLFALVPLSSIIGIGTYQILIFCEPFKYKLVGAALGIGLVLVSSFFFTQFLHHYDKIYPEKSQVFWQSEYPDFAQLVAQLSKSHQAVYAHPPDTRVYLWLLLYEYSADEVKQFNTTGTVYSRMPISQEMGNIHFNADTLRRDKQFSVLLGEPGYVKSVFSEESLIEIESYPNLGYALYAYE